MSFGPKPWQQTVWDWRAAGNFIGGGAGSGLIVFAALSHILGGNAILQFTCGSALVAFGLLCVWLEIGRPMRALHVFFHPQRSWMSREAFVATLLLPSGIAAAAGIRGVWAVAALLALAYMYCQARILKASKGIPAWREPRLVPLIVVTALSEGAGLFLLSSPLSGSASAALLIVTGVLLIVRWVLWRVYRRQISRRIALPALNALDAAARWLQWLGTLAPLLLLALSLTLLASAAMPPPVALAVAALGGVGALLTGAWFKFSLITRAAFNQGFAISQLPVRGVRP